MSKRICMICGKEFDARYVQQKTCSAVCSSERNRLNSRKDYYKNKERYKEMEKARKANSKKEKKRTLGDYEREVREYNKEHGTMYSYGTYQAMIGFD